MILFLSCSCLCPIHWRQVLSQEWRWSWSSADRLCCNYIWVINTCFCLLRCSFDSICFIHMLGDIFLAATKQLYEWFSPSVRLSVCLSVRPSVCLSHLFDYVPIILSSWNFQELLPVTKVKSMQKVKVRGQRSRSQRSQPNLTVSGL